MIRRSAPPPRHPISAVPTVFRQMVDGPDRAASRAMLHAVSPPLTHATMIRAHDLPARSRKQIPGSHSRVPRRSFSTKTRAPLTTATEATPLFRLARLSQARLDAFTGVVVAAGCDRLTDALSESCCVNSYAKALTPSRFEQRSTGESQGKATRQTV